MRAVAEFVMRGRAQAILVAVIAVIVPFTAWISAAAVGLVTLRKGAAEGLMVLAWGVLAAVVVLMWRADVGPLTALIGTMVAALVLRLTVSWPYTLAATAVFGTVAALILHTLGNAYVQQLLVMLNQFLEQWRQQMPAQQQAVVITLEASQVSGFLGARSACAAVAGVLLARWWQAMLYNPGGFREEFHRLRLQPMVAGGLVAAAALMIALGTDYRVWALTFGVPFVVAGFALVHGLVGLKGLGRTPLVILYVAWLLLWELVTIGLFMLALIDSVVDFRGRLRERNERKP